MKFRKTVGVCLGFLVLVGFVGFVVIVVFFSFVFFNLKGSFSNFF